MEYLPVATFGNWSVKTCEKLKRSVPNEIQIIGFDGIQLGNYTTPSLTTVAQNFIQAR